MEVAGKCFGVLTKNYLLDLQMRGGDLQLSVSVSCVIRCLIYPLYFLRYFLMTCSQNTEDISRQSEHHGM